MTQADAVPRRNEEHLAGVAPAPSWGQRLDGIEDLRGIAALSVMAAHTAILLRFSTAPPGLLGPVTGLLLHGLTLFFVLSGFLLYRPFAVAAVVGRPGPRTSDFLYNRVLRIWPAYLVVLVLAGFVLGTTVVHTRQTVALGVAPDQLGRLTSPLTLVLNVFLLQGWVPGSVMSGLSVSWSLVPEVSFYLLLPVFGAMAARLARVSRPSFAVMLPVAALFAVGLSGRLVAFAQVSSMDPAHAAVAHSGANWTTVFYRSILAQGDLFALGMAAGAAVVLTSSRPDLVPRFRAVARVFVVLGVLGVLTLHGTELVTPFVGLLCTGVVLVLRLPAPTTVAITGTWVLELPPLRWIGLCSYSVYLWHFPIVWWLRQHLEASHYAGLGGLVRSGLLVAVPTLALAALTYRFVELPAMRRKRRTSSPASTLAPAP